MFERLGISYNQTCDGDPSDTKLLIGGAQFWCSMEQLISCIIGAQTTIRPASSRQPTSLHGTIIHRL